MAIITDYGIILIEVIVLKTKVCKKCKIEKDISCFYKDKSKADGHRNSCKSCEGNKGKTVLVNEIENEVWKDIDDYEGLYQVSNLGRIKRIYPYEHLISNSKNSKGYYTVGFTKNNLRKNKMVHRLVAKAFILNPDNKKEVDHINTNRTDNRVENLKWVTHKENCNNPISKINYSNTRKGKTVYVYTNEQRKAVSERMKGFKHSENSKLLMSYNRKGSKNSRALKVIQYSLNNEFIKEWEYIKQASEELGVCYSSIINCCKGKRKTAGGFIWKYQNDYKVNGIFNR